MPNHPPLPSNEPQPGPAAMAVPEGLAPLPTNVHLDIAVGQAGDKWMVYHFKTPLGFSAYWFDQEAVPNFIGAQQQMYRQMKSGLVLPAGSPLIVPGKG